MKSTILTAGLLGLLTPLVRATTLDLADFDWATLTPSTSLNYTTCYGTFKCTRLLVPLDWLDPVNNTARVTLAILARPAVIAETDPRFGGSIIVNPGGPSGSGINFVLRTGDVIQRAADGDARKYEILSFDPRGVGFTTPRSDCYRDEFARGVSVIEDRAIGPPRDEGDVGAVRQLMARSSAFGRLCEGASGNMEDDIRGFMSTSSVARDMVEIVDKLDELRNGDADANVAFMSATVDQDGEAMQQPSELRRSVNREIPRIQYWGFSYGTVLGNYFASMFPGRVGRMILEAVEDVHDYHNAVSILMFMVKRNLSLVFTTDTFTRHGP
jgi:pimeloyl-ACP methyl ester carboxylesterase